MDSEIRTDFSNNKKLCAGRDGRHGPRNTKAPHSARQRRARHGGRSSVSVLIYHCCRCCEGDDDGREARAPELASSATATRRRLGPTKPATRAVRPALCNPATASMAIAIAIVLPQRNERVLGAAEQCILIRDPSHRIDGTHLLVGLVVYSVRATDSLMMLHWRIYWRSLSLRSLFRAGSLNCARAASLSVWILHVGVLITTATFATH